MNNKPPSGGLLFIMMLSRVPDRRETLTPRCIVKMMVSLFPNFDFLCASTAESNVKLFIAAVGYLALILIMIQAY